MNTKHHLSFDDFSIGRLFTQIRISDHILEIKKGRYKKVPRDERICKVCKTIEDENHFLFNCKINQNLQNDHFADFDKPEAPRSL